MTNKKLKKHIIWGWSYLILGFLGFILWASTYPLDQGVTGYGYVISKAEKITITSPVTGLIKELYKRQGDKVSKGDVLVDFDNSVMNHSLNSAKQSLSGVRASNKTLNGAYAAKAEQVAAINKQYEANKKLMEQGFFSKGALLQIQNQLSLAESEALEIKAEIDKNNSRELEIKEQLLGLSQQINLQKVVSPADGSIMNLSIKSSNISVSQGQILMDIVPEDGQLLIDARLPVEFVHMLAVGLEVDIMFSTLSGDRTKHFSGRLDYVSADKLLDPKTNQPYVESRISILEMGKADADMLKIGLPATVIVKTGKRTLMSYILRPFLDHLAIGLK
jgi:protease secretion system membrane fusion protein